MAAITWTGNAGDGNFNNPANWSPQQVPGAQDTVTISPAAATLININTADAVQALTMSKTVTLSINDGDQLTVGNAATSNATLSNAGTIELNNNNYTTYLTVGGPKVTLSGSGTILMGTGNGNVIDGAAASDVLNNTGNLIEGAGNIGGGTLTYINGAGAVVNADDGNYLYLNTGTNTVTNAGLLEATAGGGLVIQSNVNGGTTGKISAKGANVYLQSGADIAGGTLTSTGTFAVADSNTATLDGTTNALTNLGTVAVQDNTTLTLLGSIVNSGQIVLEHNNYNTDLVIGPTGTKAGTVTLSGGGTVVLGDNGSSNRIYGAMSGDTLVNAANTIAGAGQLGVDQLTLVNDGTINANGGNALYLDTDAPAVNNALIEATNTGGLIIQSAVNSSGGGTILAANANVILNGGTLAGGLVTSTGTGGVYVQGSGTLDGSAQTITNSGLVYVEDNAALSVLGTIANTGTISLNAVNYNSDLLASGATVTLTGGGTILLDSDSANLITASAAGDGLVNVNNTIEGAAQLGYGTLTFTNGSAGIVDANNGGQLVINTGTVAVTNMGLLESSANSGGLFIQTNVNNGTAGRIAAAGGNVFLQNGADIIGGTLSSSGTGAVYVNTYATLGTVGGTITNTGTTALQDGTTLTLLGTLINDAVLASDAYNYNTDMVIGSSTAVGTTTLSGGGTVSLDQYGNNRIYAALAGNTLLNQNNLITGGGQIGVGGDGLLLVNNGTIASSGGGALTINTGAVVTNNALIEATAATNLYLDGTVNSSAGGTILAASGNVLLNGATLQGGLANSAAGFAVVDINSATLDGSKHTVTNKGSINLNDGTTLTLLGTITNQGTIALNNYNYLTDIVLGGNTVTLTGGGTILFDQYTNNRIYGAVGSDTLVNVNNIIEGAGQIGAGQMILVNQAKGIIDANQTGAITLTSSAGGTVTNAGLIESTNTGGLVVQTVVNSSTGGTILANGGNVYLNSGSLEGGVIANGSNGGSFDVNGGFTLDGSAQTLTNNTNVTVNDGQTLTLLGTITNHGTIGLNNYNYLTDLIAGSATVSLTGSGTILLGNGGNNRIYGTVGSDTLVNVNNLIEGAGQVGAGQLTLVNQAAGIIDANDTTGLTINTGSIAATNAGLIEATGTGGLSIQSVIDSSSGGTVLAAGANIYIGGGTLRGGTMQSSGAGSFVVNGSATLDGSASTLTDNAQVFINDGQTLTLLGAIANSGTITFGAYNYNTTIIVGSPTVTLTGTGTIQLNAGNAYLFGANTADVLDNVSNVIDGTGQLGDGQLTLVNAGTINANSSGALTISLGSTGMNTASGKMLATGTGGLSIQNGTYTNLGLYEATDGSALSFSSNATLTNDANGTLTGGTYTTLDNGHGATISITGSAVTTLNAALTLSGENSAIAFGGTGIEASLTTIGTAGVLSVLDGRNYTDTSFTETLTDNGKIVLGGGTFTDTDLIIGNKGVFSGFGTLAGPVSNNGTIDVVGGKLILEGKITGNGTITTGSGGIIGLSGGGSITQPISGSGTLELSGGTFTIADANVTIADLQVDAHTSLVGTGTVTSATTDNGTITANGGTLSLAGGATGSGTLSANAQSVLIIGGQTMFGGTVAGPGKVVFAAPTTLLAGISLQAQTIEQTSTVALASGVSVSNLAGNTYTLSSAGQDDGSRRRAQVQISGGPGSVFTNAGTLDSNTNALISVDFANAGMLAANSGKLSVSGSLSGSGGIEVARRAQLDLTGGATYAGAISGAGTLLLNSQVTLDAGASLGVSDTVNTSLLTLASGENIRIGAGNVFTLQDSGGKDPRRAQVEVKGSGNTFTNAGQVTSTAMNGMFDLKFANTKLTTATAGTLSFLGAVSNTGTIDAAGGAISISRQVTGTGALQVGAASTLSLLGGAVAGQTATFLTTSGALDLGNPLQFAGTIVGFGASDVIDLLKTPATSETFANGVLTVEDNTTVVANLHLTGSYTTSDFMLTSDNNGGTNITYV